jgi:hypothetical protein
MKHLKLICASFIVGIIAVVCFCSMNVKGAWHYAMSASGSIEVPMAVEVFPWVGVEQLPSDILGENHQNLIEKILNGIYVDSNGQETKIGLNNPDSYINNEINNRANGNFWFRSDILGSMDFWERSDIEKFFDTSTTGLSFLIHFPEGSSDTYYLFTTSIHLGDSSPNIPIGEKIYPVYRTTLHKGDDGVWKATETHTGSANSAYYQNPITGSILVKYPSLNPDTWAEEDLGTSMDNAIYTYIGQDVTAYNDNATDCRYYKVTAKSNATLKITSQNDKAKLRVYDGNKKLVGTNGGAQGTKNLSFSAKNGTTYYIEVSGATSITFSVK